MRRLSHLRLSIVKMILALEETKSLETPGGVYGCTPLHVAIWQGRSQVVKELWMLDRA